MDRDLQIKINIDNAKAVAAGIYSRLLCPSCQNKFVEAFFSEQNLKVGYGLWFECQQCGNVEHISFKSKPEGFTPLRVSEKFQRLDDRAWES